MQDCQEFGLICQGIGSCPRSPVRVLKKSGSWIYPAPCLLAVDTSCPLLRVRLRRPCQRQPSVSSPQPVLLQVLPLPPFSILQKSPRKPSHLYRLCHFCHLFQQPLPQLPFQHVRIRRSSTPQDSSNMVCAAICLEGLASHNMLGAWPLISSF
jgi:hypothetical protein